MQQSDRSKLAGEFLSQIARLNLRLERYAEAAKAIRDEIEKYVEVKVSSSLTTLSCSLCNTSTFIMSYKSYRENGWFQEAGRVGQLAIAMVLVQLAIGDSVAAAKYYQWIVELVFLGFSILFSVT